MVKSVVGEDAHLKSIEDRLSQSATTAEVGLVIGKLNPNSDRGLVYGLVPTPPTDGGAAACSLKSVPGGRDDKKKGSKGGKPSAEPTPSLEIDGEWVAEHARQVSRMLMGGLNVIGVYVWASEASFKATPPSILSQTVRATALTSPSYSSESDERLLIHISYSPRRWACRICMLASGNLRPCDFKMGKLLASLQTFTCMYNFEIRLPISHVGSPDSSIFKNVLRNGIARHSKELQSAKALIDGDLVAEDQLAASEGQHNVELLVPFMKDASTEACGSEEVAGLVVFSGSIYASAYLGPKEPISQAILDLKGDIISSLRSRVDIIADEAEGEVSLNVGGAEQASSEILTEKSIHHIILHESRKYHRLSFPRRVLVPWLAGILLCDYLQPSETFEDLKDRCKEMMSMEAPPPDSAISEPETEAVYVIERSFWEVIRGDPSIIYDHKNPEPKESTGREHSSGISKGNNLNFLAAVVIVLMALLVGWGIAVFRPMKATR